MVFHAFLATFLAFSDPRADLLDLLGGEWISQGIYVSAKLDVAGYLREGPKTSTELASLLKVDEKALKRVLSMLASRGVFKELEDGLFANSPISEMLVLDHPDTLRSLTLFYGEEIRQSVDSLLSTVKTGQPAFANVYKEPVFDYFKNHPDRSALFQSAMAEKSKAVIQSITEQIAFEGIICDVGGGKGQLLSEILNKNPTSRGINFDLPEVIKALPTSSPRIKLQGGSFFQKVPKADVYLLKSILHDWSDEKCREILRICQQTMPNHARLYIIEPILLQPNTVDYAKLIDIVMLTVTGGRERTLDEYRTLVEKEGFELCRVLSTPTEFRILEIKKGTKPFK